MKMLSVMLQKLQGGLLRAQVLNVVRVVTKVCKTRTASRSSVTSGQQPSVHERRQEATPRFPLRAVRPSERAVHERGEGHERRQARAQAAWAYEQEPASELGTHTNRWRVHPSPITKGVTETPSRTNFRSRPKRKRSSFSSRATATAGAAKARVSELALAPRVVLAGTICQRFWARAAAFALSSST